MDPLLAGLKSKNLGLSIQVGTFAHADNIRITTTNPDDTAEKVKTVASFADRNGLNSFLGGMPPRATRAGTLLRCTINYR